MSISDPLFLAIVFGSYFLGSMVKGVTGFGAMLIAVPIMSLAVPPAVAISLTSGPVVASNLWQFIESREGKRIIKQFYPVIITMIPGSFIGSWFLAKGDASWTAGAIGIMVVLFCLTYFSPLKFSFSTEQQKLSGPIVGILSGLINGATLLAGSVLIAYLTTLQLSKNLFVGTIALLYLAGSIPVYMTLSFYGHYTTQEVIISVALIFVAFLALRIGKFVRDRVSQIVFQRIVILLLFCIGVGLIARTF